MITQCPYSQQLETVLRAASSNSLVADTERHRIMVFYFWNTCLFRQDLNEGTDVEHLTVWRMQITVIWMLEADSNDRAFTSQHSTTRWSDNRAFYQSTQYHTVVRSSCIHQSTQYHMMVKSSCIPPVNTVPHGAKIIVHSPVNTVPHGAQIIVPSTSQHSTTRCSDHRAFHQSTQSTHGGQIIVHSNSQHSTTRCSNHRAFHQSTQYHTVLRSSCISPINTLPHGGQIITSQHSTTRWSDLKLVIP